MARKHTVSHLAEDIFTDDLHVATYIPKFLTDLKIFLFSFVAIEVKFDPFIFVVIDNVFVVDKSGLSLFIAPSSHINRLYRFDELIIFIKLIDFLPP